LGAAIDGDVRAYPKRILAWHEMFKDRIAGRELAGVYCTLCGALIVCDSRVKGVQHELGTSGFLYHSNKLMYDHATQSMWSTLDGSPMIGRLVGQSLEDGRVRADSPWRRATPAPKRTPRLLVWMGRSISADTACEVTLRANMRHGQLVMLPATATGTEL
jgi:hypothetical protein